MPKKLLFGLLLGCLTFLSHAAWAVKPCYLIMSDNHKYSSNSISLPISCDKSITELSPLFLVNNFIFKPGENYLAIRYPEGYLSSELIVLQPNGVDSDGDGLSDNFEKRNGLNFQKKDSDGDGLDDGKEKVIWGPDWKMDFDKDGLPNILDPDSNNDGIKDGDDFNLREVNVLAVPFIETEKISFSWRANPEPDIDKYAVFVRREKEKYNFSSPIWEGKKNFCQIKLIPGIYYFCVVAYDLKGQRSEPSIEAKFQVKNKRREEKQDE